MNVACRGCKRPGSKTAPRANVAWGQQAAPSSLHHGWAARGAEAATAAGRAAIPGATVRAYCY
eukprot:7501799-Alexandrium_andersonii.AAC.1